MIAGARVEVAPYKRSPMDFVIWKPSTDDQPGWDSPWGRGRPGWHIECSAMARDLLGEVFDIHAGGIDLAFPHHENELAQSCCVHGTDRMANWWMHNEMLRVEGEKMSKSLGNFFTVKDLLDKGIPGEVIRFMLLSTGYRQPLDWTQARMEELTDTLRDWRDLTLGHEEPGAPPPDIVAAIADDLNFSKALAAMHGYARSGDYVSLFRSGALLGLLEDSYAMGGWTVSEKDMENAHKLAVQETVERLLSDRSEARKQKNFARADAIRDGFATAGVIVKDTPDGAVWELGKDFDPAKLEALK
jgi:cysteinyl-tRNA synthetase